MNPKATIRTEYHVAHRLMSVIERLKNIATQEKREKENNGQRE
jgi:hypothetical protein